MARRSNNNTEQTQETAAAPARDSVRVRAPDGAHIERIGPYAPGGVYTVAAEEAERLVTAKGFTLVEDDA